MYGAITPWLKAYIDIYVNSKLIDTREVFFEEDILPTTWSTEFWNTLAGANNESEVSLLRDFVARYEYFNDGRDVSFWVRSNWQWKVEIHWLNVMAKAIRAYDIHN